MTLRKNPVWKKAQIHLIKIRQSAPKAIIQALLRDSKLSLEVKKYNSNILETGLSKKGGLAHIRAVSQ
jgi:hypothetical protein